MHSNDERQNASNSNGTSWCQVREQNGFGAPRMKSAAKLSPLQVYKSLHSMLTSELYPVVQSVPVCLTLVLLRATFK
jgi:hypothetical protein